MLPGRSDQKERLLAGLLRELKDRIRAAFPDRVGDYEATWDTGRRRVIARLYKALGSPDSRHVLLAHAAGISVRSTAIDDLLLRWSGELAGDLGIPCPIDETSSSEALESVFAQLLSRLAALRRVILLVDALDHGFLLVDALDHGFLFMLAISGSIFQPIPGATGSSEVARAVSQIGVMAVGSIVCAFLVNRRMGSRSPTGNDIGE
jgi:hypothetical protein